MASSALVADRSRIVSIANATRAGELGIRYIVGSDRTVTSTGAASATASSGSPPGATSPSRWRARSHSLRPSRHSSLSARDTPEASLRTGRQIDR